MNDIEIEECIRSALDKHVGIYPLVPFLTDGIGDDLTATWIPTSNMWGHEDHLDALSCVLVIRNPEPHKQGYEDIAIATISQLFDRNLGWIRSFQDGWFGRDNGSASISGYILGRKLRLEYIKAD